MNILVIDDLHPRFAELLEPHGISIQYVDDLVSIANIAEFFNQFEVLVVRSKMHFGREILRKLKPGLMIARAGAGMDNIDEEQAAAQGIVLINAPEGNRDAVAEHVIGLILSFYRHIPRTNDQIRKGLWLREPNRGQEIGEKTLGIIGYGNAGKALARKISGFGCKVLAYDKYLSSFSDNYAEEVSLQRLLSEADIISLHIPLTSESRHFLHKEMFRSMAKKPLIVNCARGSVIKTSDLVEALHSGKVLGACLDVLENEAINGLDASEQIWFNELKASERVILSSHIAGWTFESYQRISEVLAAKILKHFKIGK